MSSLPSLGLFAVDQALAAGASRVDFVDADEHRREVAGTLGANSRPEIIADEQHWAYPVVIGAAREPEMLAEAVRCLAPGGHLSNAAMFFADTPLPLWEFYQRDITFSMGTASVHPHLPAVLGLLRQRRLRPDRVITTHPWDDAPEALLEPDMKPVLIRPRQFAAAGNGGGHELPDPLSRDSDAGLLADLDQDHHAPGGTT